MYVSDICNKCGRHVLLKLILVPGAIMKECSSCGAENLYSTSRHEIETVAEKIFTEAFEKVFAIAKSGNIKRTLYVNLASGEVVDPLKIPFDVAVHIRALVNYVHSVVQKKTKRKETQNTPVKDCGKNPIGLAALDCSLSYEEHKLLYFLYEKTYEKIIKGYLVTDVLHRFLTSVRYALVIHKKGQYFMTPPSGEADLPEEVKNFFDEISKEFNAEVLRNAELRLVQQYSLHSIMPLAVRTIETCAKIFIIVSSPVNRDFVEQNCCDCKWMENLQTQFSLSNGLFKKKKWKNSEGKRALEDPRCSNGIVYFLPCLPKLIMRVRDDISILRGKLKKMEQKYTLKELLVEYPDYTKNFILYTVLSLFLEICAMYSLKIRYDPNYESVICAKLEEYEARVAQQRKFLEENGVTSESLLFGNTKKALEILENSIMYLRERNYSLALASIRRFGSEVSPHFSKFLSEFIRVIDRVLTSLENSNSKNEVGSEPPALDDIRGLRDVETEKLLVFFYGNSSERKKKTLRMKCLQLAWMKARSRPHALFGRRDIKSDVQPSTITNILNEFTQKGIAEKEGKQYRLTEDTFNLVYLIRKVGIGKIGI